MRPDQAAAPLTLPAGGCIYLRWVTTALCCTGCFYTLRASGFSTPQSIPSLQSSLPRSSIGLHGKALVVRLAVRPPGVQFCPFASSTPSALLLQPVSSLRFQLCRRCACSRYSVYWATRHYAVHRYRQTSKCSVLTRYLLSTNYSRNTPWQYGKRRPRLQGSECFSPSLFFLFLLACLRRVFAIEPETEIGLLCL